MKGTKLVGLLTLALAMVVGACFVFIGNSDSPVTSLAVESQPIRQASNNINPLGLLPAPGTDMNVLYSDDHRRANIQTQALLRLTSVGYIHENWEGDSLQPANSNYGGFGSVVGVTGEFGLQLSPIMTARGENWITVEFRPYYSSTDITTRTITPESDIPNRIHLFRITYDRIGIYHIRIATYQNETPRLNEYIVRVRNGRVNEDFTINMTLGTSNTAPSRTSLTFNNPPTFSVFYAGFSRGGRFAGTVAFYSPLTTTRLTTANSTQNRMAGNLSVAVTGERLRFTRLEESSFPMSRYYIHTMVSLTFYDIDENGDLVSQSNQDIEISSTINFRSQVARSPFRWWTILIGLVVLGGLGLALYGTNHVLAKSQQANDMISRERARNKEQVDSNNVEKLRERIELEQSDERIYEMSQRMQEVYEAEKAAMKKPRKPRTPRTPKVD
ncbi:MAG: hypothetical protein FWE45_04845 [Firmicutes bacterium]|nr:hypothetical protein [Bacillota bacterium]